MINIHAKNFSLSEADQEKINAKAEKLLHLARDMADESTRIRVEFELVAKDKGMFRGTLTVALPHHDTLRAEAQAKNDVLTVMDELEAQIRPQIERHKSKAKNHSV